MADRIEIVSETGSTSADLLARLAGGGAPPAEGQWLVADRQTAGRGRQGRAWLDVPGNFMGSTVVHLREADPRAPSLSFVAALAAYEAVLPHVADPRALQLKWPNDLLLGGAKLAGILLERSGPAAIVGIGVNLAGAPLIEDREVRHLAEVGPRPDRDHFAARLAAAFERGLDAWRREGLPPLLQVWLAAAHAPGTLLSVHAGDGMRTSGTFAGLEPDGALRLRLADGTCRVIHAGEVAIER